jgi:hypothetical protein
VLPQECFHVFPPYTFPRLYGLDVIWSSQLWRCINYDMREGRGGANKRAGQLRGAGVRSDAGGARGGRTQSHTMVRAWTQTWEKPIEGIEMKTPSEGGIGTLRSISLRPKGLSVALLTDTRWQLHCTVADFISNGLNTRLWAFISVSDYRLQDNVLLCVLPLVTTPPSIAQRNLAISLCLK